MLCRSVAGHGFAAAAAAAGAYTQPSEAALAASLMVMICATLGSVLMLALCFLAVFVDASAAAH